jgi:hypothetical protein
MPFAGSLDNYLPEMVQPCLSHFAQQTTKEQMMSSKNGTSPAKRGRGRPADTGPKQELKTFSFEMPKDQHAAGSEKSMGGKIFNLSLYFRLIHKHKFLGRPLAESQMELSELLALEAKEQQAHAGKRK